jgi:hypothetical protein
VDSDNDMHHHRLDNVAHPFCARLLLLLCVITTLPLASDVKKGEWEASHLAHLD